MFTRLTVLERHYSYECKVQLQERPYSARPSRTQQLLNPKLVPKLTNDTPDDATRKKGVADEELARKEAERARKRELDEDDEPAVREPEPKRQRSSSVDSVSSISTRMFRHPCGGRGEAGPSTLSVTTAEDDLRAQMHNTALSLAGIKDLLAPVGVPILVEDHVTILPTGMQAHPCVQRVALLLPMMKDCRLDDSRGTIQGLQVDQIPGTNVIQKRVATGNTGIETRATSNAEFLRRDQSQRGSAV
ncbi:hypothetical protein Daus18300_003431 [Diaporthe australafricana]|uniref:Uncharacterized protein n=1 Tax=Diaporthe australafricana TaxID=127596 RepID=A0ABR3XGV3_9PEZI